ncbi:MAG: hypothetical protein KAJ44_05880 [Thermoplasmatales archaeon]|nr:hypothetical protein [Thermoplasmatales archaeon]
MIERKGVDAESIAKKVVKDERLLDDLLEGASSEKAVIKYKSLKALMLVSEQQPKMLYPEWDFFVKLLDDDNTFLRVIGATIIANLTRVDTKNKFEKIFNKYYSLLEDESMINTANIAGRSGIIAKEKPHLQSKITNKLLAIDKTHHDSECKNLIKGKAILSFDEYIDEFKDKEKIIQFVRNELQNTRPATRKKAEKFLKKWEK